MLDCIFRRCERCNSSSQLNAANEYYQGLEEKSRPDPSCHDQGL